jgi:hypothetical protein
MILWIADDGDTNAQAVRDGAFGDGVGGVVGALGMNVGAQKLEKCFDIRFAEENNVIDDTERGHQLCASIFVKDGTAGAFENAHAGIGVDSNDQDVAFAARALEVANVADVESIEATVGKNDAVTAAFVNGEKLAKIFARDNLGGGGAHVSGSCAAGFASDGIEQFFA